MQVLNSFSFAESRGAADFLNFVGQNGSLQTHGKPQGIGSLLSRLPENLPASLFPQPAPFYTAKIESIANLNTVYLTLNVWLERAQKNYKVAKSNYKAAKTVENRKLKKISDDSHWIIEKLIVKFEKLIDRAKTRNEFQEVRKGLTDLCSDSHSEKASLRQSVTEKVTKLERKLLNLEDKSEEYSVYIAYTLEGKLQGVAVKSFESDEVDSPAWLDLLATSPENLSNKVKKVKGVGTAIIKHIVMDMKRSGSAKELALMSVNSAYDFYKKIGFKQEKLSDCSDSEESDTDSESDDDVEGTNKRMCLKADNVDSFIERTGQISKVQEHEPILYTPEISDSN